MINYEITEMEENEKLQKILLLDYIEMEGREYVHKNGGIYYVVDTILTNFEGKCHRSVVYCPFIDGKIDMKTRFCRPLSEFLDGRFKEINND